MRIMTARTTHVDTYHEASEAIRASTHADATCRTVSDARVRGKRIRRMLWNDAALALELDSGQYLNIVAQSGGIQCSLDDTAAAGAGPESDEDVLFELDGHKMLWHKAALRDKYVDTALQRLWFGSNVVWVYTQSGILACHLVESYPEGICWLLWIEAD